MNRQLKLTRPKVLKIPRFIEPKPDGLNHEEMEVLLDFHSRGSKTLGQILSSNGLMGSKIMETIEKLRDFGFIRRDWEREIELGVDVVYSLTDFGREIIRKHQQETLKRNS